MESSPLRTEAMDRATADRALQLLQGGLDTVHTLDITGGAPELSPQFRSDTSGSLKVGLWPSFERAS